MKISLGSFHIPDDLDYEAKNLLAKVLVVDPSKRMKASEICANRWVNAGRENKKVYSDMQNCLQIGQLI